MKTRIFLSLLGAMFIATGVQAGPGVKPATAPKAKAVAAPVAGKYAVDPMHSKIGFEVPHLVISSVEGRFNKFTGSVEIGEKFDASKLEAEVEIASIDTAEPDRDKHLRSADFFDADKHPKMTLKSRKITGTPESFKLEGDLTIKGQTKPVTFDGKYLGAVTDAYGNQKIAFKASTKIDRKVFGLTWSKAVEAGPVVGDEVTITLNIQAAKAKEQAAAK